MKGTAQAAQLLADAIGAYKKLCVVADYDCDGATACAVALRGLRLLGAKHVDYIVPDRVVDGYGLTPPISQRVKASGADVLITVDNGIASFEGVARARARATPSKLAMPLSTVISTSAPLALTRSEIGGVRP